MQASLGAGRAVQVVVATSLPALEEHADAWDRLALAAPEQLPMLSHAWVAAFLETRVRDGHPWRCLFAYDGDDLLGVLPVVRARGPVRPRLLGPADGAHTESAYPLLDRRRAAEALAALVRRAEECEPGLWLRFFGVRGTSPVHEALPSLEPRLRVLRPMSRQGSLVDTTEPFEGFQSRLSSSSRRSLRSARKKAVRDHGLEFRSVTGEAAADPSLLATFLRVEAAGWKGQAGTAIACDPRTVAFYRVLCNRLARRGWLEWNHALFDGEVVAAHLAVRFGGSLLLPKGGYDERYADYAPGNLLFWEVFTEAFADDRTTEVNFLTNQPWMRNWHMCQDRYDDVVVSPRTPLTTISSLVEASEPRRRVSAYVREHPELQRQAEQVRAWLRRAGRTR